MYTCMCLRPCSNWVHRYDVILSQMTGCQDNTPSPHTNNGFVAIVLI